MPAILAALALLLVAHGAEAADHYLVQWKKSQQCEVVVKLPFFGSHYTQLGIYPTRWEAERALDDNRKQRKCPPLLDDKAMAAPKAR